MEPLEALAATYSYGDTVFANVTADQFDAPTPCPLFDVRALMNHAIGAIEYFASAASGGPNPEGEVDYVSDGPSAAFSAAAARSLAAWNEPGVLDKTMMLPFGESPASVGLVVSMVDTLAHIWDLAAATGQDRTLPEGPAQVGLGFAQNMLSPDFRSDAPDAAFGPVVPVADDAPIGVQLIGFIGRDPNWQPS